MALDRGGPAGAPWGIAARIPGFRRISDDTDPMATPFDTGTILTLLRRATETVRATTARAVAAEARADRLSREVGALLGRVEEALRASAAEAAESRQAAEESRRAAAEAQAQAAAEAKKAAAEAQKAGAEAQKAGVAEGRLSAERARVRRLEERLAEVIADTQAAREAAAAAEAAREAAEARLTRIRAALIDEAAMPPETERPAALH